MSLANKKTLVFDASSPNLFFGGFSEKDSFFQSLNFEKSKMGRDLPALFLSSAYKLKFGEISRVIIGCGPGSFTGIKTGISFFLAFIYSLGARNVEVIGSLRLIASLFQTKLRLKLVLIPFNRGEYFCGLTDNRNNPLLPDLFLKAPFQEIPLLFKDFIGEEAELAAPLKCGEDVLPALQKHFKISGLRFEDPTLDVDFLASLNNLKSVDITKEPFIINHMISPANLNNSHDFYVTNY